MKKEYVNYLVKGGIGLALLYLFTRSSKAAQEQQSLNQESSQAGTPTYPNSQYQAWANRLEQAMFDWGTEEETIFEIFSSLQNNADFLKLKLAFGTRTYTGGVLPGFFNDKLSLDAWLQQELDESELARVNQILSSKGITYRV